MHNLLDEVDFTTLSVGLLPFGRKRAQGLIVIVGMITLLGEVSGAVWWLDSRLLGFNT